MPPSRHRAQRAQRRPRRRRRARSSSSIADGCGNFGAPPKPPWRWSSRSAIAATAVSSEARLGLVGSGSMRALTPQALDDPLALLLDLVAPLAPRLGDPLQHLLQPGSPWRPCGREVRAGVERHLLGRDERVQRPAAVAGHRLDRVHVDRVDVGPLLAVDLDADEVLVHLARRRPGPRTTRAPSRGTSGRPSSRSRRAAGRRARAPRASASLAPRLPVDRVVLVLEQVRRGLVGEAVGHGGGYPR